MKKHRILSGLLAVALVLGLLPAAAFAADTLPITWLPNGMEPTSYVEETGQIFAFDDSNGYLLDQNGAVTAKFDTTAFDEVHVRHGFSEGLLSVKKDGKYGFVDQTGKVVIPTIYDFSNQSFSGGLAAVGTGKDYSNAKWGFVNKSGQLVVPMIYDSVSWFSEGLSVVEQNGKCGYIDQTGKVVIPLVYDYASWFNEGVAVVDTGTWPNAKCGLIDTTGRLVLPMEYDYLYDFGGEALTAYKDGKLGFIDRTGKVVVPFFSSENLIEADTGHCVVSEGRIALYDSNDKTYYIDLTGKTVGGTYDFGREFSDGLAYVAQNGKSGFIDTNGNIAFYLDVPAGYEVWVSSMYGPWFVNGTAIVATGTDDYSDELWGVVDKQGNMVLPFQYDSIMALGPNSFRVEKDGRWGIASRSGASAGMGNFQKVNTYAPGTFTDVASGAWYANDVQTAYELGLVMGSSDTTFSPTNNINLASTLALACRIHSIYHTGSANFVQGSPWYQVYVDYAVANGIITAGQFSNYTAAATRRQFAAIMANALPASALNAINAVADGAIPDVPSGSASYDAIYRLYRAGILTGSDAKGTFYPDTPINRASVAAIVARMAIPSMRKSVTIQPPSQPKPTYNELVTCYNKTVEPWNLGKLCVMVIGPQALLADMSRVAIEMQYLLTNPNFNTIRSNENKRTEALKKMRDALDGLIPCAQTILNACNEYPDIFAEAKATAERTISNAKTLRTLTFTTEGDYEVAKELMDLWLELNDNLDTAKNRILQYK